MVYKAWAKARQKPDAGLQVGSNSAPAHLFLILAIDDLDFRSQ